MEPTDSASTDETLPAPVSSDDETLAAGSEDPIGATLADAAGPRGRRPDQVGRYEIIGQLGSGGMGVVYRARDPELAREVAIKLLRGDRGGSHMARLQREAQAMARVQHPNLVTVFDVGRVGDQVFIAMELVRGQTLRAWLAAEKRAPSDVLEAFIAAGRGLVAAHRAGIVHRDFKPDNVLVSEDGEVKVLDFGLAVGSDEDPTREASGPEFAASDDPMSLRLTQTGALLGTPAYMSPEQFRGESTDARTDQFSFAVALFEALVGRRPFPGASLGELVHSVTEGHVDLPDAGELDKNTREVLSRALAPARGDRWPDLESMLERLKDGVEGPGPPVAAGLRPWVGYGVAGVLLVLALVTAAVAAGMLDRASPQPPAESEPGIEDDMRAFLALSEPAERKERAYAIQATHGDALPAWARVILKTEVAMDAWRAACPSRGPLGLCVRSTKFDDARVRCWLDTGRFELVERRDPQAREAIEQLRAASALLEGMQLPEDPDLREATRDAAGAARVIVSDGRLERYLALEAPRGLDFGEDGGEHLELSQEAFAAFHKQVVEEGKELQEAYRSVKEHGSDRWVVAAAARTGIVFERYPDALAAVPVPDPPEGKSAAAIRQAYCGAISAQINPALEEARAVYEYCEKWGHDHGIGGEDLEWCTRRRALVKERLESTTIPEKILIEGPLTRDEIQKVLSAEIGEIRACYSAALLANPELEGSMAISLEIGPEGSVNAARVRASTLPDTKFSACVGAESMTWEFPAADNGAATKVVYPLSFEPG